MANNIDPQDSTPSAEEREAEYNILLTKYVEARKNAEEKARVEIREEMLSGKHGSALQKIARRFKE